MVANKHFTKEKAAFSIFLVESLPLKVASAIDFKISIKHYTVKCVNISFLSCVEKFFA